MKLSKKRIAALVSIAAVAAIALVFAVALPQTASAHGGPGGFSRGGFDAGRIAAPIQDTYLADALGITAEELQTARQEAAEAGIDQAVAEGLITETQAERAKQFSGRFAHGFDMSKTYEEEKQAVLSGYWSLYRYNPGLLNEGKNPFIYETKDPKSDMLDFLMNEVRYNTLKRQFPEVADNLYKQAIKFKKDKHEFYKKFSQI